MSKKYQNGYSLVELVIVIAFLAIIVGVGIYIYKNHKNSPSSYANNPTTSFNFGFDFSNQEPDPPTQDSQDVNNFPSSVAAAKQVMAKFAGNIFDQSIYGFGAQNDPEPTLGQYNLSSITPRINLITSEGGVPVITLVGAPNWMYSKSCNPNPTDGAYTPPCPVYYQDFANLSAYIAKSYPQVKYFVVWNEFKGFYTKNKTIDYTDYTNLYNDVYKAIKQVRPDALVGGPYAPFSSFVCSQTGNYSKTLNGSWGCIDQSIQNAFSYWLAHKIGADFVAIDGATIIAKTNDASLTNPLIASQKYAAVDQWIRSQTNLPIWWMESHIAPNKGWSMSEGAAARIATLILMNTSGATVGMQWQPQEQTESLTGKKVVWPDEGLWTTTEVQGGGQATPLANELIEAASILKQPLSLVNGEPSGVIVAKNKAGTILVNTNNLPAKAIVNNQSENLKADQVLVSRS